ncbi:IS3 family transposase, partial [Vreelandella boliviensis]
SLYNWIKRYDKPVEQRQEEDDLQAENRRLKAELKRVSEERDIFKKGHRVLRQGVRLRYAFIQNYASQYSVRRLCQMMAVHPSGYYAWCKKALSNRAREDERLLGLIKHSWLESGGVYGYRKVYQDLREAGEACGKHRVARLMSREGLRSQTGYRRRPGGYGGGKPAVVSPNHLDRQFEVKAPNVAWVTDITYIRTYEGWLYLAVVIDLFSRQVVGWSMKSRMTTELVLDALLSAVWRRKPQGTVMVHSDQGSQFSSGDWQSFLKANHLVGSMSRRGNCHDNAVAESFFQLLKRERIKRQIYSTREAARRDVFNYIEMFYNPKRRHGTSDNLSPVEYERRYFKSLTGV